MDQTTAAIEMPRYTCHKKVWALRIKRVDYHDDKWWITPQDEGYAKFEAPDGWAARFKGTPDDRGVYVVYPDGYASWSPTKAFDEGYTRDE